MVILGLDPGTTRIGYGVIKTENGHTDYLESGLLNTNRSEKGGRLNALEKNLTEIIGKFRPDKAGIEKLFFAKNIKTALAVAESRGVLIKTLMQHEIPICELSPSEVKLAVAGNGRATKDAVAKMVRYFLPLSPQRLLDDVSDALATALAVQNRSIQRPF